VHHAFQRRAQPRSWLDEKIHAQMHGASLIGRLLLAPNNGEV